MDKWINCNYKMKLLTASATRKTNSSIVISMSRRVLLSITLSKRISYYKLRLKFIY